MRARIALLLVLLVALATSMACGGTSPTTPTQSQTPVVVTPPPPPPTPTQTVDPVIQTDLTWVKIAKPSIEDELPSGDLDLDAAVKQSGLNVVYGSASDYAAGQNTLNILSSLRDAALATVQKIAHELAHWYAKGGHDCHWDTAKNAFTHDCKWGSGAFSVEVRWNRVFARFATTLGLDAKSIHSTNLDLMANWIDSVPAEEIAKDK